MKTLLKLQTLLCSTLIGLAACDTPPPDDVIDLAAAPAPVETRTAMLLGDPDEAPIEIEELVACDAVPISTDDEVPVSCGDDACELVAPEDIDAAQGPYISNCGGSGYCTEVLWQDTLIVDNPCGSCSPQPNLPGWKRTFLKRWHNACGCVSGWWTDQTYCNHC